MNFRKKALDHIESAKEALMQEPANPAMWNQLRIELHQALVAATLAEHMTPVDEEQEQPETMSEPLPKPLIPEAVEQHFEAEPEAEALVAPEAAAGPSIAEALSVQRIASIQSTLSINDRVRFAGDLFGGDVEKLLSACSKLEQAESYEIAVEQLEKQVLHDVDWGDEEGAPYEFLQRLRRLFA